MNNRAPAPQQIVDGIQAFLSSIPDAIQSFLAFIEPTWPGDFRTWYHAVAIGLVVIAKLDRGNTMRRRARRIDFFGASIITFDLVFGSVLGISLLWLFYPKLHTTWFDYITTGALAAVAIWQEIAVRTAPYHRLDRAINPEPIRRGDGTPISEERRREVRREADREKDTELNRYRSTYGPL